MKETRQVKKVQHGQLYLRTYTIRQAHLPSILFYSIYLSSAVCLSVHVMLLTRSSQLESNQDLVRVIAVSSGMSKFVFISP